MPAPEASGACVGDYRVTFAEGAPRDVLLALLASLTGSQVPPQAEVVKRSRARLVLRVPLADGSAVYVKRELLRRPAWARWRASRAQGELRNLERLRALGVPVVEPLCVAESRERGGLLVTRAAPGAIPLERLLAELEPEECERALGAAWQKLAPIARRLHDQRLWHRDLHLGNVLVEPETESSPGGVRLVDLQKLCRLPSPLPRFLRASDLAMLVTSRRVASLEPAVRACVAAYTAAGEPELPVEPLAKAVRAAAERRLRRRLRSRARRCVRPSSGFRIERVGRHRVYRRADFGIDAALAAVAAAGDRERVAFGRRFRVDDVVGGPPPGPAPDPWDRGQGAPEPGAPARAAVAVARFPGRLPGLRHTGLRAWRNAHALLLRGIDTPAPLALVEERRGGRVVRSSFLARWDDAPDVTSYTEKRRDRRDETLGALERFVASLRELGIEGLEGEPRPLLVHEGAAGERGGGELHFAVREPERVRIRRRARVRGRPPSG